MWLNADEIRTPMRFVVTVDTEADDAWSRPDSVEVSNIRALDRFQDLCDHYDVVPTYLVAYECATREEALATLHPLATSRHCEIGHHLHVWTTPPFQKADPRGVDLDWLQAFQFQLPDSLFAEKAEALRAAIEKNFGRSPTSHRAGRWGIDQRTVNWLANAGFTVDTSMRTGIRLRNSRPGGLPPASSGGRIAAAEYELRKNPYRWRVDGGHGNGKSLIEVPATVDAPVNFATRLYLRYLSMQWPGEFTLFRLYRKLAAGLRMLYPNPHYPIGELPRIMDRSVERGVTVLNLAFHSSELALNCSPLTRTAEQLDAVWRHIEDAFRYIHDRNIQSAGLSDVAKLAKQQIPPV